MKTSLSLRPHVFLFRAPEFLLSLSLLQLINESRLALLWQSPERILPRCRRKSSVSGPGNWSQDHLHHGASDQSEASIDKHWPIGSGYIALRISRRGQARNCPLPSHLSWQMTLGSLYDVRRRPIRGRYIGWYWPIRGRAGVTCDTWHCNTLRIPRVIKLNTDYGVDIL